MTEAYGFVLHQLGAEEHVMCLSRVRWIKRYHAQIKICGVWQKTQKSIRYKSRGKASLRAQGLSLEDTYCFVLFGCLRVRIQSLTRLATPRLLLKHDSLPVVIWFPKTN